MVFSRIVQRTLLRSGLGNRLLSHPHLSYEKKRKLFYRHEETSVMQEPPVQRIMRREKE